MSFTSLLNKTCTIQTNTPAQDSYGQMIESWADTLLLVACRLDVMGGGRVDTPREIYESATHILFLKKPAAPTLTTKDHRVVIDGANYKILLIDEVYGSVGTDHLELILEKVT